MEKIICPICGREMVDRSEGGAIEVVCPNCGNGWAAYENNEYDELYVDKTVYSLFIDITKPTTSDLKTLSKILNLTALNLKISLKNKTPVMQLNAIDIKPVLVKMTRAAMPFHTVPDFKHKL